MKKIIILSGLLCLLGSASADAQISVTIGDPGYARPAYPPRVYDPSYAEYHHRYPSQYYVAHGPKRHEEDWSYWSNQRNNQEGYDQNAHDNGNRGHW